MTESEFKTWTRHTAENLITQRDEAVARADRADAVTNSLRVECETLKSACDALKAECGETNARCLAMAGHPDVVAALRGERIKLARMKLEEALMSKLHAELALEELGVEPRLVDDPGEPEEKAAER